MQAGLLNCEAQTIDVLVEGLATPRVASAGGLGGFTDTLNKKSDDRRWCNWPAWLNDNNEQSCDELA